MRGRTARNVAQRPRMHCAAPFPTRERAASCAARFLRTAEVAARLSAAYPTYAARMLGTRCSNALHSSLSEMRRFVDAAATSDVRLARNTSDLLATTQSAPAAASNLRSVDLPALRAIKGRHWSCCTECYVRATETKKKSSRAGTKMTLHHPLLRSLLHELRRRRRRRASTRRRRRRRRRTPGRRRRRRRPRQRRQHLDDSSERRRRRWWRPPPGW